MVVSFGQNTEYIIHTPLSMNDNLPLLALQEMLRSSDRLEKEFDGISNKFIEKLGEYDFPGNLSELKNIIGESVIRSRSKTLGVSDLSDTFSSKSQYNKKSGTPEIQKEKFAEIGLNSRGLVAIFFADMVGYTSLMQENEAVARELIEIMRSEMKRIIENYDGKNLTYVGDDETLCTFGSAIMAVTAAIEMQKILKEKDLFKIWIGIHIGDVVVKENEIYGDGVNVASRLEPLAAPGEICISQDVYKNIHNQVDRITESMGVKNLKNVQSDMHVYKVVIE